MSEDFGFDADSSKKSVKQGRRARQTKAPTTPDFEAPAENESSNPTGADEDGPPKPNRVSGWGEDAPRRRRAPGEGMENFEDDIFQGLDIKSEIDKIDRPRHTQARKQMGWDNEEEDNPASKQSETSERLRPRSPDRDSNDSDNDIPVIPDLEEQQEEDITQSIAYAPNVAVNRVATYRELDNDLLKQAAFLTLDSDIDLKILTKSLATEADLLEEDKAWDWDRLFTEVTSELLTQWEKAEESEPASDEKPQTLGQTSA